MEKYSGKSLFAEIVFLVILLSSIVIIAVESTAMAIISRTMQADLNNKSVHAAREIATILEEPLYILDNAQVLRIGEALLSSGRISGIRIVSSASGLIIDQTSKDTASRIRPIAGIIERHGLALGDYYIEFSDTEIIQTSQRLFVVAVGAIIAVIIANTLGIRYIVGKHISKAFMPIFRGLQDISAGAYDKTIPLSDYEEVDRLISIVNLMTSQINSKNQALQEANRTLEYKVSARTIELEASIHELNLAHERLVQSEKLSALGQLSAGMAHELNTPLGAILSSSRLLTDFFDNKLTGLLTFYPQLDNSGKEFITTLLAISRNNHESYNMASSARKLRQQAVADLEKGGCGQSERLAELLVDLGLNTHIGRLRPWLQREDAAHILEESAALLVGRHMVEVIEIAGDKAANVVSALRSYLSPDASHEQSRVHLESEIDKILTLMHNMLKHGVTVTRDYAAIDLECSKEKVGQVILNIIRNAAQAISYKGNITIRTRLDNGTVVISIEDDGPGIPPEVLPHIFKPFFTTKHQGDGMGLGLDICRHIIEQHHGSISAESRPGRTCFVVRLPRASPRSAIDEQ